MSMAQLRQLFALESQDTLQQMEDSLMHLEKNPDDSAAIKTVFRAAHTIKGSAGVVGLDKVSAFTHRVEHVLDKLRNGKLAVTPDLIRLMLACRDQMERMLEAAVESDESDPEVEKAGEDLQKKLQAYLDMPEGATAPVTETPPPPKAAEPPATPEVPAASNSPASPFANETVATVQQIRELLNVLRSQPHNTQLKQILLSAAHGIVASASQQGFMPVSHFAEALEQIFRLLNDEQFEPDSTFIDTVSSCCDHLDTLLIQLPTPESVPDAGIKQHGQDLIAALQTYREAQPAPTETVPEQKPAASEPAQSQPRQNSSGGMPVEQGTPVTVEGEHSVTADNWHISLRFNEDALSQGVEPLASLRYLGNYGEVVSLYTLFDTMPLGPDMNPECCYLGFEIEYKTQADKKTIEELFELVQDFCRIRILPPHSQLTHYIRLIQDLPEDTMRLGEILLQIGTLTKRELEEGLELQIEKTQSGEEQGNPAKIGEILVESGMVEEDVVEAALNKQRTQETVSARKVQKTLNVDAEKLDQLINLVGELVIANAGINLLMQEDGEGDRLKETVSMMSRLVEEIRNSTLRMRMVHIGGTFNRFRRLIHDLNHDLGKNIELVISGAEAELDKSMIEKITDPLMHLVRNAVDHGIESPEERLAKGKPAAGTVTLNAYHDSGSIVIEISDDGRGLNRKKILAKAIKKGIFKPSQDISEEEIDQLIFDSGLSTADTITELSGRGVGLDVVKRNINALNGTVEVDSEEGEGSTFRIFLPLTLAIIDGFLLGVGGSSFVVPLDRVVECVEFSEEEHQIAQSGYLNLRGKVLPLLRLRDLFGIEEKENDSSNIIVVRYGNQEAGLIVDELLGEFQAVIKPLGKIFEKLSGVSGATILGSGEVALILDIPGLVQKYALSPERVEKLAQLQRKITGAISAPAN